MLNNRVFKNATWIIVAQIVKSIIGFVITMLTARYLGPSNYGLINYASSVVAFVTPLLYLGFTGILVQEIVVNPEKEGETLGTAIILSLVSSIFCICGILAVVSLINSGEKETIIVCALYSVLLVFQSIELIVYWFQAKLLSKYSSVVMLIAYFIVSLYKVYLLVTSKSVRWFAISNAIDYFIIAVALLIIYRKLGGQSLSFSKKKAADLLAKGKYYIVSDMMVTVFAQTDRIMLKLMISDAAVGYYSAAVSCAGMTGFVFSAIIDSFRPAIFEKKQLDSHTYETYVCRLYSIIIYLSLIQSAIISAFSPLIVNIVYGSDYTPTISVLKLIVWYTTFSYMGGARNIWILSEGLQKYLWMINLSGVIANIVLNSLLIPNWGAMGAAFASVVTQFFTNFILGFILKPIRANNKLILKSLNVKCILEPLINDLRR